MRLVPNLRTAPTPGNTIWSAVTGEGTTQQLRADQCGGQGKSVFNVASTANIFFLPNLYKKKNISFKKTELFAVTFKNIMQKFH